LEKQGVRGMKIREIVVQLSPEETLRLTRILVDEDREEAMLFLKECLKPQLDKATRDH
jgi:hypothetical protein